MPFTNPKNLLEANMNSFDDEELDAAFENIRYYAENGEDMWESTTSAEPESNDKSQPTTDDDSSLVDDDYLDALYEKISE